MENKEITITITNAVELTKKAFNRTIQKLEPILRDTDFTGIKEQTPTEACARILEEKLRTKKGLAEGSTDVI